jgi:hypothetical protein
MRGKKYGRFEKGKWRIEKRMCKYVWFGLEKRE